MVLQITEDNRQSASALFSADGFDELIPPPAFDYRSYELDNAEAESKLALLIEGMTKVEDKTGRFVYQLPDGRIIDTCTYHRWEWPQAIGMNGLFDYYHLKSSLDPSSPVAENALNLMKEWYYQRTSEGIPTKNINSMAVMYSVACLLDLDRRRGPGSVLEEEWRQRFEVWVDEWAEWIMYELPRTAQGGFQHVTFRLANEGQLWDDTLMMTVIPLTKIGLLLNRPHYIEEAKFQFLLHTQYLMDEVSGFWYHAWKFDSSAGSSGTHSSNALWARGNCWITLAIPMFIELTGLAPSDPVYRMLVSTFHRQVDALIPLQDTASGLWHTLLDDPSSYVETSGSAGFVGGMLMGIRLGLLDRRTYLDTAISGLKACLAQVTPTGQVGNVSKGTPAGKDRKFYKGIPRMGMVYGNSLLIVALVQWMRLNQRDAGTRI
uniref:Plant-inducible protein n=1 Tax=Kwoniella dejecticola CBS 10117 TaxID=1296121 RepID=A0A1A6A425_9TREE|nr:uncharacterized protein I303_04129 [Kwoniella dejecticola CBS 10117]OBR84808.1 hypothetical protein I303_04129 [Kwoniella dejecticola CBS 10117]